MEPMEPRETPESDLARLLLYRPERDSLLRELQLCLRLLAGGKPGQASEKAVQLLRRLCAFAERLGLAGNIWQARLAYELLQHENPWSLACEGRGAPGGTLSALALGDMERLLRLFAYDFSPFSTTLGLGDAVAGLLCYAASPARPTGGYGWLTELSGKLAQATPAQALALLAETYQNRGVGAFAFDMAFQVSDARGHLEAVRRERETDLSELVGYDRQKQALRENTEAFLKGLPSNNVLLYGDAGTGKSTCVRALPGEYPQSLLRIISLDKGQMDVLPGLLRRLQARRLRFILFLDDLSFEAEETDYKYLKAVIEGGLSALPENIRIYATSNRRHIIRETWNDRTDMEYGGDIHRSDTMEEKLSLAGRFGVTINFSAPNRREFHEIVRALAARDLPVAQDDGTLLSGANAWELRHGGITGRTARQYIDYLAGKQS